MAERRDVVAGSEIWRRHRDRRVAGERPAHRTAARAYVRRANACEHGEGRHFQLQRNQTLVGRSRIQKSPQAGSAWAVAAHPRDKTINDADNSVCPLVLAGRIACLTKRLLIHALRCFDGAR